MQATAGRMLELLDEPEQLEALYREDAGSFRDALEEASVAAPDSITLGVWRARLGYRRETGSRERRRVWSTVAIALSIGALVRIPAVWLGEDWYSRFAPSLVVLSLAAYFWLRTPNRRLLFIGLGAALGSLVYVNLVPGTGDSVVMALIHLPIIFWALLGVAFAGAAWRDSPPRIRFVRYNGELLILGSLVGLGGMVLSGITVGLFSMLADGVEVWYFNNVAVVGAVAVPVTATYLYDAVFNRHTGIPTVLARVFTPLFLVMVTVYLVVAFMGGENPFVDRAFLIRFNALLVLVLAMSVFSVVERSGGSDVSTADYVNLALVFLTLLINVIALSAILFRLASFGFTPNRVTVLGANLAVFAHLCWLFVAYVRAVRRRGEFRDVQRVVARYLPVYAVWAALVTFVLPILFAFA